MKNKSLSISLLLVATLFCYTVVSCSKDDEPKTSTTTKPPGTPESTGATFIVDGVYYNVLSSTNRTCEVTYTFKEKGVSTRLYKGDFKISASVDFNDVTYSVISIGYNAFSYCTSLTSITIPNSVTSIDYAAFSDCTSLISVNIPESVTSIDSHTFDGCTSLTSVTIPNSVTTIYNYAFHNCTSLPSVTIPNSVTTINEYAFQGCTSLMGIYSMRTTPPKIYSTTFDENMNACVLYVPQGSLEAYKNNWGSYFTNILEMD